MILYYNCQLIKYMKKIFKFEKTYTCLDDQSLTVYIPLTIKICPKDDSIKNIDGQMKLTIENIIEHAVRYNVRYITIDEIYYQTFRLLQDIYVDLRNELSIFGFNMVDIYIGDKEIDDDANYIKNINKYFENKQN